MHNPRVSDEAKEHSRAIVEGRESGMTAPSSGRTSDGKDEGNVLRGHKVSAFQEIRGLLVLIYIM